jgi:hypothetical protein
MMRALRTKVQERGDDPIAAWSWIMVGILVEPRHAFTVVVDRGWHSRRPVPRAFTTETTETMETAGPRLFFSRECAVARAMDRHSPKSRRFSRGFRGFRGECS